MNMQWLRLHVSFYQMIAGRVIAGCKKFFRYSRAAINSIPSLTTDLCCVCTICITLLVSVPNKPYFIWFCSTCLKCLGFLSCDLIGPISILGTKLHVVLYSFFLIHCRISYLISTLEILFYHVLL